MLKRVSSAEAIRIKSHRSEVQGAAASRAKPPRVNLLCRATHLAVLLAGLALLATPTPARAACVGNPGCGVCEKASCLYGEWACSFLSTSTACDDGNVCTINDHCDGHGQCVGGAPAPTTTACNDLNACTTPDRCNGAGACVGVPGVPGNITGPTSTSTSGSYTLSWTAACGAVTQYTLYENGTGIYTGNAQALSASIGGRSDGTYTYKVQACSVTGCGPFTPNFTVTVLHVPGPPAWIRAPSETGPSYTVSWASATGSIDHYDLGESYNGGAWTTTSPSASTTSAAYANKAYGSYFYQVRACNASGCSPYVALSLSVSVITPLSSFPDSPLVGPTPPTAAWVGAVPGQVGVEGGAATYAIPVAIPPGRAGLQPTVALTYSSRTGNGVAGVGWALSASSTIYRCPRTVAQDGFGRPVRRDSGDRLCLDGQRLVTDAPVYGNNVTEYRTEIDRFARITQGGGDFNNVASTFQVEHKSGRISQYDSVGGFGAASWVLTREYDRQGNCIQYTYEAKASVGYAQELELTSIKYTGTGNPAFQQCSFGADARTVSFIFEDRPDKKTSYRYGFGTMMVVRLKAISTSVGSQSIRRYELAYKQSAATGRSLLQSIKICAGGSCGSDQLAPTTFIYEEGLARFDRVHMRGSDGNPLGPDWSLPVVGDLDGDGTRELVYTSPTQGTWLQLSSCPQSSTRIDGTYDSIWQTSFFNSLNSRSADIDGDGRVDAQGLSNGYLTLMGARCSGSWSSTPTDLAVPAGMFTSAKDWDGDGLLDIELSNGPTKQFVLHRNRDPQLWAGANSLTVAAPPIPANSTLTQTRDINGDGMLDTVWDYGGDGNSGTDATTITFFNGFTSGQAVYQSYTLQALGGPSGSFFWNRDRRWIDVNGDGLPDIYDPPSSVWINKGGPAGAVMFQQVPLTMPSPTPSWIRTWQSFALDVDGDGLEELMVPAPNRAIEFCYTDPSHKPEPVYFCGSDFDTAPGYKSYDRSIFPWDAYKFVEVINGTTRSYALVLTSLGAPLLAPTNEPFLSLNDQDGNGMTDVYYLETNWSSSPARGWYSDADANLGPYVAHNLARAPDVLLSAVNGLGATATWVHRPLSDTTSATDTAVGCDMAGDPFYSAQLDAPRGRGYAFFASSMWAVARLDVSNGLGSGTNPICYRYRDALLNTEGRGFQGFRQIVSEEQLAPAAGETAAGTGTRCAGGPTCSVNNIRTTTVFHQEFPLTDRPKVVAVAVKATGKLLRYSKSWWHTATGSKGSTIVYQSGNVERKYDAADASAPSVVTDPTDPLSLVETTSSGAFPAQTTRIAEIDAVSGEAAKECTISKAATPDSAGTPRDVVSLEDNILFNDPSKWWLGRIDSRTTSTEFMGTVFALDETCTVTGTVPCRRGPPPYTNATPPSCPTISAAAISKTTTSTWYTTVGAGSYRKVNTKTLTIDTRHAPGTTESVVTYAYDSFGNVFTKQVSARDAGSDSTWPPAQTGLVSAGQTSYDWGDGYFLLSETDPLGHKSSRTFDAGTGQILTEQKVQGGPVTTAVLESWGAIHSITTDGSPSVQLRPSTCLLGSNCATMERVYQFGAPIRTTYKDKVGRVIATGIEGFDGKENFVRFDFNTRGIRTSEYVPFHSSWLPGQWSGQPGSPYSTQYDGLDAAGRYTRKIVNRNGPALSSAGLVDSTWTTTYVPSANAVGTLTTIFVPKAATVGGALSMSRTYDRRGKLIQTSQHVAAPMVHDIITKYLYDAAGNLTQIIDSQPNTTTATYDDLGRKLSVSDPDRGYWSYTSDGLGRLRTQVDARNGSGVRKAATDPPGVLIAYQYDLDGRLQRRFTQGPTETQAQLDASWVYDQNGRAGTLSSVIGADGFRRDYLYDAMFRPWRVVTQIPAGASGSNSWTAHTFTLETGYDRNYGRRKATKYPSGEIASTDYDGRGNMIGETNLGSDGTRGVVYRLVAGMSERDQITSITFGNGISESAQFEESTGMPLTINAYGLRETQPAGCAVPLLVHEADYQYDQFLNVAAQSKQFLQRSPTTGAILFQGGSCTPVGITATEAYQYDELQRLRQSARSWIGMPPDPQVPAVDTYVYDDLGNITTKSDYGDLYTYGDGSRAAPALAGPHAVVTVTKSGTQKPPFSYDGNGSMIAGDDRTITFDKLNRPTTVTANGFTTQFRYAPDGLRYLASTVGSGGQRNEYYDAATEQVESASSPVQRTYLSDAVMIIQTGSSQRVVNYRHLDHLRSLDAVTVDDGSERWSDAHGYDAFGKPRARDWSWSGERMRPPDGTATERGFTGHEHFDNLYLIHMNGRMYDYRLGRFLSVDPIISNPANSQSINPYSYIGNNPLSGVDPTGYESACQDQATCGNGSALAFESAARKESDLVAARKNGSIAGRAGDNTRSAAIDQDTIRTNVVPISNGGGTTAKTPATANDGTLSPQNIAQSMDASEMAVQAHAKAFFDEGLSFEGRLAASFLTYSELDHHEMAARLEANKDFGVHVGMIVSDILLFSAANTLKSMAISLGEVGWSALGRAFGAAAERGAGEGITVYRVWGGVPGAATEQVETGSIAWGRSWTTVDPRTVVGYRNAAGLPDLNAGRFMSIGELQDTTGTVFRASQRIGINAGGLPEVVVPRPELQIQLRSVLGLNPEF